MMNLDGDDMTTENLEELERRARGMTSRRTAIPPTPRDTLAVLRQAAEAQREEPAVHWLPAALTRAVVGIATALLLFAGARWILSPAHQPEATQVTGGAGIIIDPGLDLADWELEFEAVWEEIDQTLTALETQEAWETL
jgi:hypothetical protein